MPRQELIYSPNLHRYPLAHATTGLDLLPNLHRYPLAHATTGISSALFNTKKGTKTSDSYVLLSLPQIATLLSLPQILTLLSLPQIPTLLSLPQIPTLLSLP